MILKINDRDIENIMDNLHELRKNILFVIGFQRVVREEDDTVRIDDFVIN